jgi:hypothetical protein
VTSPDIFYAGQRSLTPLLESWSARPFKTALIKNRLKWRA